MHRARAGVATKGAGEEEAMSKFPKIGTAELAVEDVNSKGGLDVGDKRYNVEIAAYDDRAGGAERQRCLEALRLCSVAHTASLSVKRARSGARSHFSADKRRGILNLSGAAERFASTSVLAGTSAKAKFTREYGNRSGS
jgi:hypothetical protein